ncbi:MAG: hypothetical protein PHW18_07250 [Sulfuricurvum sp.]|uniref:hypothetical protein n=1 Tax=Sulfuricurvum sp. TaxID=2025608 RepID=UPI002604AA8F|nr:hypothetical protein [Sulfuricurvum sp.]MDD2829351.1 hypothetical protein [Sulfuricurvum sp.]MDD4949157.1 hypothetical protein [Sulfuricurvum sp.]
MKQLALLLLLVSHIAFAEPSVLTPIESASPQSEEGRDPTADEKASINQLFSKAAPQNSAVILTTTPPPSELYIGEIFPLTIKLTPTDVASGNIEYTLQNEAGIRIFSQTPQRVVKNDGVYDTFYFLVQDSTIRLPDITATVSASGAVSEPLIGTSLNASGLNPPSTYANVLANSFKVIAYKTTAYNQESNIVVFTVKATRCNIATFSLVNAIKQGFESKTPNVDESTMTYYAVIPNSDQTLEFSIFNLQKNRYESISIPIVVDDDTVSTQSDLSPTDSRHTEIKIGASAIAGVLMIALYYWKRQKWYLIASVLPLFYFVFALLPNNNICVKKNAPVHLLPIKNGTVFKTTTQEESFEVENTVGEFKKVHLDDNTLGWVHENDLCSH